MSLTSPKLTTSLLLPMAVVVVVVSGLSVAGLFATVILELDKASLSLMEAVVSLAAPVNSELLLPVESVAPVDSSSVAKLPGELVVLITLANNSAARVALLVVAALVVPPLVALVSAVSSMLPPELQPVLELAFVAPEVASLPAKMPEELAA